MSNFNESLDYVLKNEGLFSSRKSDKGGPTMMGITLKTYSEYLGRQATIEELKALTKETVAPIYYHLYWAKLCLSMVNNNNIATAIFDIGVNCGVEEVAILTQKSLVTLLADVKIDGLMGFKTCEAIDKVDQGKFILTFENEACQHYYKIVLHDSSDAPNLPGWLARAGRLLSLK